MPLEVQNKLSSDSIKGLNVTKINFKPLIFTGTVLKMSFPRVAPVTGTPRSTLGQLQIDPADPSPSLSATSSESSSPVPSTSQSRRKQKVKYNVVSDVTSGLSTSLTNHLGFVYIAQKAKASRWIRRESYLLFILSSDKDQRK